MAASVHSCCLYNNLLGELRSDNLVSRGGRTHDAFPSRIGAAFPAKMAPKEIKHTFGTDDPKWVFYSCSVSYRNTNTLLSSLCLPFANESVSITPVALHDYGTMLARMRRRSFEHRYQSYRHDPLTFPTKVGLIECFEFRVVWQW